MSATTPLTVVMVTDPLLTLVPAHDSTVALMEEAQERGHRVLATTAAGLRIRANRTWATCRSVSIDPAHLVHGEWRALAHWWQEDDALDVLLDDVDIVMMRTDPPVDRAYLRATYLLDQVDSRRVLMVNDPRGLREANEKLFTLRFPDVIPDTLVSADLAEIEDAARRWGRAVLKPTDAMAGRGIMVLRPDDANLRSIVETATDRGRTHVIVQRYLSAAAQGDRRVIVVDGEPVGAVRRVAAPGEFRCNMAAGASVIADGITTLDKEICELIAPELIRLGIVFAGIDVIGDRMTEVNVTSPTGLREIDALSGSRLPRLLLERFEQHVARLRR